MEATAIRMRVDELREELAKGRRRAAALDAERDELRDTLLRIAGAVQVLEELLARTNGAESAG
jgi:hypothetical protein